MIRLCFALLISCFLFFGCGASEAEVEEFVEVSADSVKMAAGYDLSHLKLTEADLTYAPQKMTKHHILGIAALYCDSSLMARSLAEGADPNMYTEGMLPLFEAALCEYNSEALIQMLLDYGVDVNSIDYGGETALNYAIAEDQFVAVDFLLEKGASMTLADEIEGYGCPPPYSVQSPEMLAFLVARGADFSGSCTSGMTLLHFAAEKDNGPLIQYILDHELVDPKARDESGATAFDVASNYASVAAQDLLRPFR